MTLIVKAYKNGDFAFVHFSDKEDLYRSMDNLIDAGFRIEQSSQEEEDRIVSERCHEETTPEMMNRVKELSEILSKA